MKAEFNKRNISVEGLEITFNGFVLDKEELRYALEGVGSFEDPNYTQYEIDDVFISFNGQNAIEELKRLVQVADKLDFAKIQVARLEEAAQYFVQNSFESGRSIDAYEDPDDFFYYQSAYLDSKKLFEDDFDDYAARI